MANIVLIGTGGVRAPRQVELAQALAKRGHRVRCINTTRSLAFLSTYFLKNPSKIFFFLKVMHSPLRELFCYFVEFTGAVSHVGTALWADIIVVAPATCNTIAKITTGITYNFALLVIRAFSRNRKVLIVPSMNPEMWADPANQHNIQRLTATEKYAFVGPVEGTAVSGDKGLGIMAPNLMVVTEIEHHLAAVRVLAS